jgi:hypothetical protein
MTKMEKGNNTTEVIELIYTDKLWKGVEHEGFLLWSVTFRISGFVDFVRCPEF